MQIPYDEDHCSWVCNDGFYRYGEGCFPCSTVECNVGQHRSSCSSVQDSTCVSCSNGPSYSTYIGSGTPFNANNCAFQCNQGYFLTNGSCQQCSSSVCDVGMYRSSCSAQDDGKCVPCTNGPLSGDVRFVIFVGESSIYVHDVEFLFVITCQCGRPLHLQLRRDSVRREFLQL